MGVQPKTVPKEKSKGGTYSDQLCTIDQQGTTEQRVGKTKSKTQEEVKCIVQFRPHKGSDEKKEKSKSENANKDKPKDNEYQGEYGFDWLRIQQDKTDGYALYAYEKIIQGKTEKAGRELVPKNKALKDLRREYKDFSVSWKKDENGDKYIYYVPWLSIRPEQEVTLDLVLDVDEKAPPKSLTFACEQGDGYFSFDPQCITGLPKEGHKTLSTKLKITCKQALKKETRIIAYANYNKDKETGKKAGELIIVPNAKRPVLKITFVEVYLTEKCKRDYLKTIRGDIEDRLQNYGLNQALIDCEFTPEVRILDLRAQYEEETKKYIKKERENRDLDRIIETINTSIYFKEKKDEKVRYIFFTDYMEDEYSFEYSREKNEYLFFFIDMPAFGKDKVGNIEMLGEIKGQGGDGSCCMYNAYRAYTLKRKGFFDTLIHEGGHGLDLPHSHYDGGRLFFKNDTYTFNKFETKNFMDYKNQFVSSNSTDKVHFWKWQWKIMREYVKEMNKETKKREKKKKLPAEQIT